MSINKVFKLRKFIAEQLQSLIEKKITPEEANACAMLSANLLLSIKLEMEYSKLKGEKPSIEFMESKNKLIDITPP